MNLNELHYLRPDMLVDAFKRPLSDEEQVILADYIINRWQKFRDKHDKVDIPAGVTEIKETVSYWSCGIPGHKHRKKHTAINCLGRQPKKKPLGEHERREQYIGIARMRLAGHKWKEIGETFGVSTNYAPFRFAKVIRIARTHWAKEFKHINLDDDEALVEALAEYWGIGK